MNEKMVTPDCFEMCENCKFWNQFNKTMGFCDEENNSNDKTMNDSWCEKWEEK